MSAFPATPACISQPTPSSVPIALLVVGSARLLTGWGLLDSVLWTSRLTQIAKVDWGYNQPHWAPCGCWHCACSWLDVTLCYRGRIKAEGGTCPRHTAGWPKGRSWTHVVKGPAGVEFWYLKPCHVYLGGHF